MTNEEQKAVRIGTALVAAGSAFATYILMKDIQKQKLTDLHMRAIEDVNLRTELLNWLIHEVPTLNLTQNEVQTQLEEKLKFISTVSNLLIPSRRNTNG